jgi:alpha-tubulin suppressor-like RCC1 family protein
MGLTSGGIRQEPLEMLPGETVVKIVSGGDHLVCLTNNGEIVFCYLFLGQAVLSFTCLEPT